MAKNKDSFILYVDQIHAFEALTDTEAGKLIKHIFRYVNDQDPKIPNRLTGIAFEPIKRQLKRDLVKWRRTQKKRSEVGKKGGIKSGESRRNTANQIEAKRSKMKQNEPIALKSKQNEANEAVNVTVNDNVTVNVNDSSRATENFYNAEELIIKNQIQFEKICMAAGKSAEAAAESLRKYHLHLEENEKYPRTRRSIFAGFEKWLLNEKLNGYKTTEASGKHKGAGQLITSVKKDISTGRKENN